MKSVFLAVALVGVALVPEWVSACPVCAPGADENRVAFIATTAFMTAMPLLMVGGFVVWLLRRSREVERAERAAAASPPAASRSLPARS